MVLRFPPPLPSLAWPPPSPVRFSRPACPPYMYTYMYVAWLGQSPFAPVALHMPPQHFELFPTRDSQIVERATASRASDATHRGCGAEDALVARETTARRLRTKMATIWIARRGPWGRKWPMGRGGRLEGRERMARVIEVRILLGVSRGSQHTVQPVSNRTTRRWSVDGLSKAKRCWHTTRTHTNVDAETPQSREGNLFLKPFFKYECKTVIQGPVRCFTSPAP